MDKLTATRLFQEFALEGLPAAIYPASSSRPTATALAETFGEQATLMVRTATGTEARNLPRRAGVDVREAANWIANLPSGLAVVIQPFSEVVFSVELAIYADRYLTELVPGIWELETRTMPAVLMSDGRGRPLYLEWQVQDVSAKFYSLAADYTTRLARVEDWHVSAVIMWVQQHQAQLAAMAERCGRPCGVKLHYAEDYGLSPQNIRTNLPALARYERETSQLQEYALVSTTAADVPTDRPIVLDVSVARESGAELATLVDKLRAAEVDTVYVTSGLLSHLAIGLREAGLNVRRFDGRLLRN